MLELYQLQGTLGDKVLLEKHESLIVSLLQGNKPGLRLEPLEGHEGLWTIRITLYHRLLFSLIQLKGKWYLLLLEEINNHDHHKSRFLRDGVFKNYLKKHESEHISWAMELDKFLQDQRDSLEAPVIEKKNISYYKREFIELDLFQGEALSLSFPALLVGVAGSGKSCVALSLLSSYSPIEEKEELPVLYVTQSKGLVREMTKLWQELEEVKGSLEGKEVHLRSYEDLCKELLDDLGEKTPVSKERFTKWYSQHLKKAKVRQKKEKTLHIPDLGAEKIYQEFRICSGYKLKPYLDLGQRQSLITKEDRGWVYKVYEDYRTELDKQSEVDFNLSFHEVKFNSRYGLVVVDEAQDLSYQALRLLKELAVDHRIVFCQDGHQNLRHKLSSRPYLEQLFGEVELKIRELFSTYRCPLKVIEAANEILTFKQCLSGGLGEKREMRKIAGMASRDDMGHVFFLSEKDLMTCSTWNEADFAIVTSEEHLESARAKFKNALIFIPETIKGLEYPKVLAYRLFSKNFFQRAAQRIEEMGGKKQPIYRAKAGQSDNQFVPELNGVYTTWTRASSMLFLYEDEDHYAEEFFWKDWRGNMEKGIPAAEVLLSKKTSRDEWLVQVDLLLDTDNADLAFNVCQQLGFTAAEFQHYVLEHDNKVLAAQKIERPLPLPRPSLPVKAIETKEKELPPVKRKKATLEQVQPPITLPAPVEKKTLEEILAVNLDKNFEKNTLRNVLSRQSLNLKALLLNPYVRANQEPFILMESIAFDPDKRAIFSSCIADCMSLFMQVPLEEIKKHFVKKRLKENEQVRLLALDELIHTKKNLLAQYPKQALYNEPPVCIAAELNKIDMLRLFKKLGADFNLSYKKDGASAIHIAAAFGHGELLRILVEEYKLDVNQLAYDGYTALYLAVQNKRSKAIKMLLGWKADFKLNPKGRTLIHMAAQNNNVKLIELLANDGLNLNVTLPDGATPIFLAVENNNIEAFDTFFTLGADCRITKKNGANLAHVAAENNYLVLLERIKKVVPDLLNQPMNDSMTPLCLAIVNGSVDAFNFFMTSGIDFTNCNRLAYLAVENRRPQFLHKLGKLGVKLDLCVEDESTPAHLAAFTSQVAVFKVLKEFKADLNKKRNDGLAPIHLALKLKNINIIEVMADAGADLNLPNDQNETLLYMAVTQTLLDLLPILKKFKVDLEQIMMNGLTPACFASKLGYTNVISELHRLKVAIHKPSANRFTPAMCAVEQDHCQVLIKLKSLGANLHLNENTELSLLFLAIQYQSLDCLRYLLQQGLNPNQKIMHTLEHWRSCMGQATPEAQEKLQAVLSARYGGDYSTQESLVLTSLDLAEIAGNQEVIELLKEKITKIGLPFFNSDSKRNLSDDSIVMRSLENRF